jgi:16S rRNA (adenine1518-N6/adenine1519-N6)-dimethyltransferase
MSQNINVFDLLKKLNYKPKKALGQNFLFDPNALRKIIKASDLKPEDYVLEIGTGLGSLTELLSKEAFFVTTIEIDRDLSSALVSILKPLENVKLIEGDILEIDIEKVIPHSNYIVVANIPYYITSAVIRKLLESKIKPRRIILTIQREVAERICGLEKKMSILTLSVLIYGNPKIFGHIPANCFYPKPNVESSILIVDIYDKPLIQETLIPLFFTLVHAGFNQKRKTIRNALSSQLPEKPDQIVNILSDADINPQRRAETLSIEEWKILTTLYSKKTQIA